jgi:hypothetical protein
MAASTPPSTTHRAIARIANKRKKLPLKAMLEQRRALSDAE